MPQQLPFSVRVHTTAKGPKGLTVARAMHAADAEILAEALIKVHRESPSDIVRVTITTRSMVKRAHVCWERFVRHVCRACGDGFEATGPASRSAENPVMCSYCYQSGVEA